MKILNLAAAPKQAPGLRSSTSTGKSCCVSVPIWMYDRFNLAALLLSCRFTDPGVPSFDDSVIDDWYSLGLDMDESGNEYKPESLYMEATRCFAKVEV